MWIIFKLPEKEENFWLSFGSPVPPGVSAGGGRDAHEPSSHDQRRLLERQRRSSAIHSGCCRLLHPLFPRIHHRHGVTFTNLTLHSLCLYVDLENKCVYFHHFNKVYMHNFCRLSDILQLDECEVSDCRPQQQEPLLTRRQESVKLRLIFYNILHLFNYSTLILGV